MSFLSRWAQRVFPSHRSQKQPPELQAIVFDLDGTLVDTEAAAVDAVKMFFEQHDFTLKPEHLHSAVGKKWEVAFDLLYEGYPWTVSKAEMAQSILSAYRAILQDDLPEVPGAAAAVRALAQHWPLALVSGSSRRDIEFCLGKFGVREHFGLVLGSEDYVQSKPSPEGYMLAFQHLSVSPSSVLVFEDSEAGIRSAQSAGAKVVAVTGSKTGHLLPAHFLPETPPQNPHSTPNSAPSQNRHADAAISDFRHVDAMWIGATWKSLHSTRT